MPFNFDLLYLSIAFIYFTCTMYVDSDINTRDMGCLHVVNQEFNSNRHVNSCWETNIHT